MYYRKTSNRLMSIIIIMSILSIIEILEIKLFDTLMFLKKSSMS